MSLVRVPVTASGTEGRRRRLRGSGLFEKGGYETEFSTELSEVAKIDQMLKLTNSVKVEIIPGSNENLANMNFTWQVVEIQGDNLIIDTFFENTDYISADEENPDVVVFTFQNTEKFLKPVDDSKVPI